METTDFWEEDSAYFTSEDLVTDARVAEAERRLGYRLPEALVRLLRTRNGGVPRRTCFPTTTPTSWADNHIAITCVKGLGGTWGIDSEELGTRLAIEEWGYPAIGVVICECPSAGHDKVMLDYRSCGPAGAPAVVHVEVESGDDEPAITHLADTFEEFIDGLVDTGAFDTSEKDRSAALFNVREGRFSPLLEELLRHAYDRVEIARRIRRLAETIIKAKGHFSLHADPDSYLLFDVQFLLFTEARGPVAADSYLIEYSDILTLRGEFSTGGHAPQFVRDWLATRLKEGTITTVDGRLLLAPPARARVLASLASI